MNNVIEIAKIAKEASINALNISDNLRFEALTKIADNIDKNKQLILNANKEDLISAEKLLNNAAISKSAFNRLKLDDNKINDMIQGIRDIASLDDIVNKILWEREIADGIILKKQSCPIGVIAVIFEARPDVISQISALAIKTSNAVILKGGSEAVNTNNVIFEIISNTLNQISDFPKNIINLIHSRDDVNELLKADKYINLIIPRGSNALVKYIKENTAIPVLGHADGVCHIYIDEFADIDKVLNICTDSKCQYPSACNSVETILINEKLLTSVLPELLVKLRENGVEIAADDRIFSMYSQNKELKLIKACEEDWYTEYGDKKLSIKTVKDTSEAINHINKYGSGHTDCIITESKENAEKFMLLVDSAGVYHNISTRFADGYRYGFGAEVGISTNKTHARGPVGIDGLTIYKYKLYGNGDIVDDFIQHKRSFNKNFK